MTQQDHKNIYEAITSDEQHIGSFSGDTEFDAAHKALEKILEIDASRPDQIEFILYTDTSSPLNFIATKTEGNSYSLERLKFSDILSILKSKGIDTSIYDNITSEQRLCVESNGIFMDT